MTLKYESEILFDLMKRDGDDTPSDVLPYESELKEKYLHQVEGAYPKLQDYRPEWLNYNLNAYIPADFPVESVSNVTNATFENVVPYAYGSAILKGDTKFINEYGVEQADKTIFHSCYFEQGTIGGDIGSTPSKEDSTSRIRTINPLSLEIGSYSIAVITGYEVYVKIINSTNNIGIRQVGFDSSISFNITDSSKEKVYIVFRKSGNANITPDEVERIVSFSTIPELTSLSLVSVKMPVLTTSGKNLFDKTKITKDYVVYSNGELTKNIDNAVSDYIKIEKNKTYIKNSQSTVAIYDVNKIFIERLNSTNVVTASNDGYIRCNIADYTNTVDSLQIEEGSVATSYEPYKSNILTVNEGVTLQGIGEVQDTLDCLKGELTQRVAEETLITTGWSLDSSNTSDVNIGFYLPHSNSKENGAILSEQYPILTAEQWKSKSLSGIYKGTSNIGFVIARSSLSAQTLTGFKEWLTQNPITIKYELATPVVKTVDLTVTDQDGNTTSIIRPIEGTMHLMTEGDTIKPLFSGEIPVEATTQNLMSFANILEEE